MVFMKINNEYTDGCLSHLEFFLSLIDNELSKIDSQIQVSSDPDAEGLCDKGEYLIGFGFVAIQRYMASTFPQTAQNKKDIYKLGHKLKNDSYLIEIINAGANYWKHEPEWPFILDVGDTDCNGMAAISLNRTGDQFTGSSKNTCDLISNITPYSDYTLSNLLTEILKQIAPEAKLAFSPILPLIEEWRNELDNLPAPIS